MKTINISIRKHFWLPIVAFTLLALVLGPASAQAQTGLIAYDGFDYDVGLSAR